MVDGDVWVYDLARGTDSRLTFDPATRASYPLWTPDGQRVAFQGYAPSNALSWKEANGSGDVERLMFASPPAFDACDSCGPGPNAFYPDGSVLVFQVTVGPTQLRLGLLSLRGDGLSTIWDLGHSEMNADLSPDGRWLAYESNETGEMEVFVRPFPAVDAGLPPSPPPEKWQVSRGGGRWPLWNPDGGQELFYVAPQAMMAVAVETQPTFRPGSAEPLFDTAGYATSSPRTGIVRRLGVSPDGTRFLLYKVVTGDTAAGPTLILVQNWADELQRLVPTP